MYNCQQALRASFGRKSHDMMRRVASVHIQRIRHFLSRFLYIGHGRYAFASTLLDWHLCVGYSYRNLCQKSSDGNNTGSGERALDRGSAALEGNNGWLSRSTRFCQHNNLKPSEHVAAHVPLAAAYEVAAGLAALVYTAAVVVAGPAEVVALAVLVELSEHDLVSSVLLFWLRLLISLTCSRRMSRRLTMTRCRTRSRQWWCSCWPSWWLWWSQRSWWRKRLWWPC